MKGKHDEDRQEHEVYFGQCEHLVSILFRHEQCGCTAVGFTNSFEPCTAFLNGSKPTRSLIGMDFIHSFLIISKYLRNS